MDQELIAYLDRRFGETSNQIERLRQETSDRLAQVDARLAALEEGVRQTQVLVENLRGDVCQVAEGVIGTDETLRALRKEIQQPSDDLRALLRQSYSTLDSRVHRLESWRETKERDPIDIIREKWGRPAKPPDQT